MAEYTIKKRYGTRLVHPKPKGVIILGVGNVTATATTPHTVTVTFVNTENTIMFSLSANEARRLSESLAHYADLGES